MEHQLKKLALRGCSNQLKTIVNQLEAEDVPHFMTGSRCWGVHSQDSDFDLCIHFTQYEQVKRTIINILNNNTGNKPDFHYQGIDAVERSINEKMNVYQTDLKESDFEHSTYGAGVKVNVGGDLLNIIRLTDGDFIFWLFATNAMYNIYKINPNQIVNKTFRHSMFENLRSIAKATITYDGWKLPPKRLISLIKEMGADSD